MNSKIVYDLVHTLIFAAEIAATHYLVVTLLGALSLTVMKLFASNKKDVEYAALAVQFVKSTLGDKLGPKADVVLSVWSDGLKAIQNGKFTNAEIVDEFVKFIKAEVFAQHSLELTGNELHAVRTAASTTIRLMSVKASPTNQAVKSAMVEPAVRAMCVQALAADQRRIIRITKPR